VHPSARRILKRQLRLITLHDVASICDAAHPANGNGPFQTSLSILPGDPLFERADGQLVNPRRFAHFNPELSARLNSRAPGCRNRRGGDGVQAFAGNGYAVAHAVLVREGYEGVFGRHAHILAHRRKKDETPERRKAAMAAPAVYRLSPATVTAWLSTALLF
jgi:hypothetical protein